VSARFEELDWQRTPMGELSLRRRFDPVLGAEVHEVKLGEEYLMSSAFTVAEEELSRIGLAAVTGDALHVLVGGLGLGYTATTALADPRVATLTVVEALGEVVGWHRRELLPESARLVGDPRTRLVTTDFFGAVAGAPGGDPVVWDRDYDAVLVDIDHTPRHVLHESHRPFYSADGLARLRDRLRPGGVFALWSDDPPDPTFLDLLGEEYVDVAGHVVAFPNAYTGGESTNSVMVARRPAG
jgi:spermidine synthase